LVLLLPFLVLSPLHPPGHGGGGAGGDRGACCHAYESPVVTSRSRSGRDLALGHRRLDDLDRDPDLGDHHRVRPLQGGGGTRRPEVLEGDQERRAVRGKVVADLLGVLLVQGAWLGDVDLEESGTLLVEIFGLDDRDDTLGVLAHEQKVDDADRAVLNELQDRRGDTPGELVARKANDVDVDGTDFHVLSFSASVVASGDLSGRTEPLRPRRDARYRPLVYCRSRPAGLLRSEQA